MVKDKLSIIIPVAQEHPQAAFTVQALYNELRDMDNFEIVVIDNHCPELTSQLARQGKERDGGGDYFKSLATDARPWLKYIEYSDKLSHWNAKNAGVRAADGEYLFFCDAHCVPSMDSLWDMVSYYKRHHEDLHGTIHLPLSYMLDHPGRELEYKLIADPSKGVAHYQFTKYRYQGKPCHEVAAMSTCGMLMHRLIYQELGGWPDELGIYGGGEHFINFSLAVMGYKKYVYEAFPLYHYAAPRGYHWNYDDYHRNRTIATMCFGGVDWATRYAMNIKGSESQKQQILDSVTLSPSVMEHAAMIQRKAVTTIDEWLSRQEY